MENYQLWDEFRQFCFILFNVVNLTLNDFLEINSFKGSSGRNASTIQVI